jgi:hypothetical protein
VTRGIGSEIIWLSGTDAAGLPVVNTYRGLVALRRSSEQIKADELKGGHLDPGRSASMDLA